MNDLDKARELAREIIQNPESLKADWSKNTITSCIELSKQLLALDAQTRWRDVEEELPEKDSEVFFWWNGLDNCYRWTLAKYEGDGVFWVYEMNREAAKEITHWRYIGGTSSPSPEVTK